MYYMIVWFSSFMSVYSQGNPSKLSSMGNHFRVAFPDIHQGYGFNGYAFVYTNGSDQIKINLNVRSYYKSKINDRFNTSIAVWTMAVYTFHYLLSNWTDRLELMELSIGFQSKNVFGLHIYLQQLSKNMAIYPALPVSLWRNTYVILLFDYNQKITILSMEPNYIRLLCNDRNGNTISNTLTYYVGHTLSCKQYSFLYEYKAGKLIGNRPFAVFLLEHAQKASHPRCPLDEPFMSGDMPYPIEYLGQDFILFGASEAPGDVVLVSYHDNTKVTYYVPTSDNYHRLLLKRSLEHTFIEAIPVGRRLESNQPIQVYYILKPICKGKNHSHGELSVSVVIPNTLFYKEYFFSTAEFSKLKNYIILLLPTAGWRTLVLNDQKLSESRDLNKQHVYGTYSWEFVEKPLLPLNYHLTCSLNIACYLYGVWKQESYVYVAAYQRVAYCSRSNVTIDDEIDNDCDGEIDEELLNLIDDDDDKKIDEDTHSLVLTTTTNLPSTTALETSTVTELVSCLKFHWGNDCATTCPYCTQGCHQLNGICIQPVCTGNDSCLYGTDVCIKFRYGSSCQLQCDKCLEGCRHIDGVCLDCDKGISASNEPCLDVVDPPSYYLLPLFCVPLIIIFYLTYLRDHVSFRASANYISTLTSEM